MPTKTKITDEKLREMIENSYLELGQKIHLIPLIPVMDDKEREGFLDLMKQAEEVRQEKEDFNLEYNAGVNKLNAEYEQKLDKMVKEETDNARHEFESISHNKDDAVLDELEEKMNNI